ncbi:hypothetical protein D049_3610B, partial [Vibrio parahaemolyticus VPTS-2010]
QPP